MKFEGRAKPSRLARDQDVCCRRYLKVVAEGLVAAALHSHYGGLSLSAEMTTSFLRIL